jgi:hypothetical protein
MFILWDTHTIFPTGVYETRIINIQYVCSIAPVTLSRYLSRMATIRLDPISRTLLNWEESSSIGPHICPDLKNRGDFCISVMIPLLIIKIYCNIVITSRQFKIIGSWNHFYQIILDAIVNSRQAIVQGREKSQKSRDNPSTFGIIRNESWRHWSGIRIRCSNSQQFVLNRLLKPYYFPTVFVTRSWVKHFKIRDEPCQNCVGANGGQSGQKPGQCDWGFTMSLRCQCDWGYITFFLQIKHCNQLPHTNT